jgi:2,4-dienoyl-CoA reductase-like NADH-dependent reductase (Old Yellow Enzyme family)
VHAKGGTMVVQLWHTGRVSHQFSAGRPGSRRALGDPGKHQDLPGRPGLRRCVDAPSAAS